MVKNLSLVPFWRWALVLALMYALGVFILGALLAFGAHIDHPCGPCFGLSVLLSRGSNSLKSHFRLHSSPSALTSFSITYPLIANLKFSGVP
jgi:hypothetical protein